MCIICVDLQKGLLTPFEATRNLSENLGKLNGSFKDNPLVKDVIEFITKDKKRSICTPFS